LYTTAVIQRLGKEAASLRIGLRILKGSDRTHRAVLSGPYRAVTLCSNYWISTDGIFFAAKAGPLMAARTAVANGKSLRASAPPLID
jgi:hypothetical protein